MPYSKETAVSGQLGGFWERPSLWEGGAGVGWVSAYSAISIPSFLVSPGSHWFLEAGGAPVWLPGSAVPSVLILVL